jgi:hypothetical protein
VKDTREKLVIRYFQWVKVSRVLVSGFISDFVSGFLSGGCQ